MAILIDKLKLAFFPVPEVASTSLTKLCHQLNTGKKNLTFPKRFTPAGRLAVPFSQNDLDKLTGFYRIAIVRDPFERFLSCYQNQVLRHKELGKFKPNRSLRKAFHLRTNPNLAFYTRNINAYRSISRSIRYQSSPQSLFLGSDLAYFHKIYTMLEFDRLLDDLAQLTGITMELPQSQRDAGQRLLSPNPIITKRIIDFTMGDYALLKDYYDPFKRLSETRIGTGLEVD